MGEKNDKKKHKKHKSSHHPNNEKNNKPSGGAAEPPKATDYDEPGPSGRKWTLSVAVPGTLLDQPPSLEVAVCVAAQIARAAAAFQVDEVVVYDDSPAAQSPVACTVTHGTALLARVLQYLDTPPHLRPNMYGDPAQLAPELQLAAALPMVNPPHHARPSGSWIPYREGVVLKSEQGTGSYVDVGLDRMVWIEHELPQLTRLTVHLGDLEPETRFMAAYSETMIVGKAVPPSLPREQLGLYWGYTVRVALGLKRVFKDSAVGQYDLTIGSSPSGADTDPLEIVLPVFKHALVVFGGGSGGSGRGSGASGSGGAAEDDLEQLVSRVPDWAHKMPQDVFNLYLNTT
ncbi:hypothetical protein VaNZ11_011779, partial [Volvox africanus]